ncbi:polysaccharide lyase 6 family protein [Labilibacter marinus]|uniref:polysaccharide lyase 6 family protein n=1 Tax=Labilibacter marinus TaxID=1477105 RepID=UPI0008337E25|nr:polysaccharide lyase 6 family protein [Labilibacter marinus]
MNRRLVNQDSVNKLHMTSFNKILVVLSLVLFFCSCADKGVIKVKNVEEFNVAVKNALPGDVIQMANGVWKNTELKFDAKGTAENPIQLVVEERGKVKLEGQSRINISGEHLIVNGLVFTNGHTPASEVISFKKKKGVYANNCRVTECVIDNYNPIERMESTYWVSLYGKNNRVDHCYLVDKRNKGVTMAVRMVDEACRENNHRIDHNYFGYRQNLGANGGETLRIGTSHYSLSTSATQVDSNYFESCDGEHEIISNKSCGNQFIDNTFYECRGTLTYRHGNDNVSKGNFFIGNNKEYTGGIRIINKRNKAINNYFSDLKGYRFRGSLVIMNGVPNSAINRYHQVDGGVFANNTFVNCDHIQLCSGSDEERSAVPINSVIENNVFYHDNSDNIFTVFDDISGIEFKKNIIGKNLKNIDNKLTVTNLKVIENEFGFKIPQVEEGIGSTLVKPAATADNTGVSWYPKAKGEMQFNTGKTIEVKAGVNTLFDAIVTSQTGDVIVLSESGDYVMDKMMELTHPITIKSATKEIKPVIKSSKAEMFLIANGGGLKLQGIEINGAESPDYAGNSMVSTSHYSMNCNYKFLMEDCQVTDLDVNHSFDFLKVYKNTMADSILIRNCQFSNITGNIMLLNKEKDDLGIYNAEYVVIENSEFKDVKGSVLNLYRGGTDESTFGPALKIDGCVLSNVGFGKRNKTGSAIYTHGVQVNNISNLKIDNSHYLDLYMTNGEPITNLTNIEINNSKGFKYNNQSFTANGVKVNGSVF